MAGGGGGEGLRTGGEITVHGEEITEQRLAVTAQTKGVKVGEGEEAAQRFNATCVILDPVLSLTVI